MEIVGYNGITPPSQQILRDLGVGGKIQYAARVFVAGQKMGMNPRLQSFFFKIESETDALTVANFEDGTTEVVLRAGKKRAGVVELQ
jgi:hypothetical protein